MENSSQNKGTLPDEYILQLSGLSRNLLLKISKMSTRFANIGLVLALLFYIFLAGSFFAQIDSWNDNLHFLIPLFLFAFPTIFLVFALYYLLQFGNKTKEALYHDKKIMLSEGLKQLYKFIQTGVLALLFFLFTGIIIAFYVQRMMEIWST